LSFCFELLACILSRRNKRKTIDWLIDYKGPFTHTLRVAAPAKHKKRLAAQV